MEPMDIDWKNIDSLFVKDELYEYINAPKWVDFSAPDESVDDEAWFCRPDCQHPKSVNDFKVKQLRSGSKLEISPLGERKSRETNLKRRALSTAIPSFHKSKPERTISGNSQSKAHTKFWEDGENEDPNTASSRLPHPPNSTAKIFKESIKSSAEKKKKINKMGSQNKSPLNSNKNAESPAEQRPPSVPRLRSTLSARNLFGGRDIFNQVTEFCNELKKLAFSAREKEKSKVEKEKEPLIDEKKTVSSGIEEEKKERANKNLSSNKIFSPEKWKKKKNENQEKVKGAIDSLDVSKVGYNSLQVRSCPPTPQRFPCSSNGDTKATTPLKLKEIGELEEVEKTKMEDNESISEEEREKANFEVINEEARPVDVLWFLKPCAYLVK